MGLLIRFERVQVQLRAQEENTIKILETIKRANILQIVFVVTLVVSQICYVFASFGTQFLDFKYTVGQAFDITAAVFEIAFLCILGFLMYRVNTQLALFFNDVGIQSYPKKSLAFPIAAFILMLIHRDVVYILSYYIVISKIYFYLTAWFSIVMYPPVYLAVTGAFYFLADFGLETRIDQARP